jgi:hypothetical protein
VAGKGGRPSAPWPSPVQSFAESMLRASLSLPSRQRLLCALDRRAALAASHASVTTSRHGAAVMLPPRRAAAAALTQPLTPTLHVRAATCCPRVSPPPSVATTSTTTMKTVMTMAPHRGVSVSARPTAALQAMPHAPSSPLLVLRDHDRWSIVSAASVGVRHMTTGASDAAAEAARASGDAVGSSAALRDRPPDRPYSDG